MVDVVDAIVAELIVKDVDKYEAGFDRATAAHKRFLASTGDLKRQTFDLGAEGRKYKAGVDGMARAEQDASAKVTRSRKQRADAAIAQDEREVASAKKAAKAKADAEVTEAQRSARIRKAVEKGVANSRVTPGSGANLGRTVPRQGLSGVAPAGSRAAAAAPEVAAAAEVNHLLVDQATLQAKLSTARGKDRDIIREQLAELRLIGQLQRAGLRDDEIALRLEQRRAAVVEKRAASERSGLLSSSSLRNGAASAALGATIVGGVTVAAVESALNYGKALKNLSDQLGITTDDLQAYLKMARDAGVSQETLSSAFGQFASNLGRAQQGQEEYAKVFRALGIDIKNFASAGDALPTVIDRISQLKDPLQRAAIETRLFGEEGRKLDSLLSQGAAGVSELSRSLLATGAALSAKEIQELDETARKLAAVKAELQVDLARVVAGNATAILTLAGTFATLATRVFEAIAALEAFAKKRAEGGSFTDAVNAGRAQTAAGRQGLLRENEARQDEINAKLAGKGRRLKVSFGRADATSAPDVIATEDAAYRQELKALRIEHRALRTGSTSTITEPTKPTPPVQLGTVNLPALARLGTPAGPRGPSADQLAKQADQRQRRYEDELGRAQDDLLSAQRDLTLSTERRYEIDVQSENAALARRKQEIQREANEKQIDASRVAELQAAEEAASAERLKVLAAERAVRIQNDANALRQQVLDAEVDMLSVQEGLAETAAERRRIAERRLAKEREAETTSLNAVINSTDPGVSEGDRERARQRLGTQDARYGARAEQDRRNTEGPFEAYRRRLNRSPEQLREAAEGLVIEELDSVHDGIAGALKKAIGTDDPLISGLIDLFLDQVIFKPLANAFDQGGGFGSILSSFGSVFGLGGGGKGGGSGLVADPKEGARVLAEMTRGLPQGGGFGGIAALIGSIFGRASGGNIVAGVPYMVGEHGPEIVQFGASGRVFPNGALPSIGPAGGGTTILAPQHFDLSGVVMTETIMRQFEQRNREYANAVAAQAGRAAVAATPARLSKLDTLGS